MKLIALAALTVALGSIGCSHSKPADEYTFLMDPSMSPEQAQVVLDAADMWKAVVPVQFDMKVAPCPADPANFDDDHTICTTFAMQAVIKGAGANNPTGATGRLESADRSITRLASDVLATLTPVQQRTVAAHELGHAMGLWHDTTDSSTLMNPYLNYDAPGPMAADVTQWHSIRQ